MIKDITRFPLLDMIQKYDNIQEVILLSDEGIERCEQILEELRLDMNNAVTDFEQEKIGDDIIRCYSCIFKYEHSKMILNAALNNLKYIFN